jgi:hypothetical protein
LIRPCPAAPDAAALPEGETGQPFSGKKPADLTGFRIPPPGSSLNWMLTFFNILFRCKMAAAELHLEANPVRGPAGAPAKKIHVIKFTYIFLHKTRP